MTRRVRVLCVLAAMSMVAASCGDDDDGGGGAAPEGTSEATSPEAGAGASTTPAGGTSDGSGGAAECTEDQAGGELTFGIRNEPSGWDPTLSGSVGSQGGAERMAILDTVMRYDPETAEFEPRLAESLEPNDDLTEWTLTLREGVTFTNGEPLTTEAVQFSVNRHRAEDSTSQLMTVAQVIESMEIVDEQTMVFHLVEPYGNFESVLASGIGMVLEPGAVQENGIEALETEPLGAGVGPFTLDSWSPGEEIVMSAKDDYWGGPVCLDTVRFVRIEENAARYEAFVQGEVDVAFLRSPAEIADAREQGFNLYTTMSNGGLMLMINSREGRAGADLRVRKAIALALDPEVVDQRLFDGMGVPSKALLPESSPLYTDGIEALPYDPEQARELLDEVKAETGYDGSLHFVCNTTYLDGAIAITGMLEAAGFTVNNDSNRSITDWITYLYQSDYDYDITCHSMSMTDTQPWATIDARMNDGPDGWSGFVNEEWQAALAELREATSLEERQEAMVGVQDVWNETVPSVIYGHVEEGVVWSDEVEGIEFGGDAVSILDQATIAG